MGIISFLDKALSMKRLLSFLFLLVLAFSQGSCTIMSNKPEPAPVKYVYSSEGMYIHLEVQPKTFKLLIKRPSGYCYNEGLYRVSDEKMKLRTLQIKADPLAEKRYRENQCDLASNSVLIVTANKLKYQDFELSRVN